MSSEIATELNDLAQRFVEIVAAAAQRFGAFAALGGEEGGLAEH